MDSINAFQVNNTKWKSFDDAIPPRDLPCWLKLDNNNVVLAAHAHNGIGSIGWWKVWYDNENSSWKRSSNEAYLTRGAVWQPCSLFQ